MSNMLMGFSFDKKDVRTMIDDNRNMWFVAKDVCDALGIANSRDAVARLDDDEKSRVGTSDTNAGEREMNIISESGLYAIILRSQDAMVPGTNAHRFRKWVTSEVLPTIRKVGEYSQAIVEKEKASRLEQASRDLEALSSMTKTEQLKAVRNLQGLGMNANLLNPELLKEADCLSQHQVMKKFGYFNAKVFTERLCDYGLVDERKRLTKLGETYGYAVGRVIYWYPWVVEYIHECRS